jgi:hypothetical protein
MLLLKRGACVSAVRIALIIADANEVHVLQEAVETVDTQDSDLNVKKTA